MPINYNQQTNSNLDYQGLLEQLGRDREFINNYQQVEPSNRYKRMLQQELAYQAKDNGIDYGKLDNLPYVQAQASNALPTLQSNKQTRDALFNMYLDNTYGQNSPEAVVSNALANLASAYYGSAQHSREASNKGVPLSTVGFGNGYSNDINIPSNSGSYQTNQETYQNMRDIYQAFRNNGFSHNQSLSLLAEVGRENTFKSSLIFGSHSDPKNKATNVGIISWQGDRRKNLLKYLNSQGLLNSNGTMKITPETRLALIDAQVKFLKNEMQSGNYKYTVKNFLNNPEVDKKTAIIALQKFILWDMYNPEYQNKGLNTIAKYHNTFDRIGIGR